MATSETARKASADFHARRTAEGWRKVTVWLKPETVFKVDALKAAGGGVDGVVNAAVAAWPGPGAPDAVVKLKPAPKKSAISEPGPVIKAARQAEKPKPADKLTMPRAAFGARLKVPKGPKK